MALARSSAGFVPDRPDLGHRAEGLDLATEAFFAQPRDGGRLLHAAAYRSLAFAELEDDAVWSRAWLCIGLGTEIPSAGDLLPFTAGHHGIHVQRTDDGGLVGRFNKAQHGGCRSVPLQCRTGTKTKCSFTACGYSRDGGRLLAGSEGATPAMHQYLGLRPERLLPVAVAAQGPLILVNLAGEAPPPAPRPEIAGAALGGRTRSMEFAANWKLLAQHLADGVAEAGSEERLRLGSRSGDGTPLAIELVFPNLVLMRARGETCAAMLQPTALGQTLCRVAVFGAPESAAFWTAELERRAAMAEAAQARIGSAPQDEPASAANEAALWLQTCIGGRVLSRPEAGPTMPLYSTASR